MFPSSKHIALTTSEEFPDIDEKYEKDITEIVHFNDVTESIKHGFTDIKGLIQIIQVSLTPKTMLALFAIFLKRNTFI